MGRIGSYLASSTVTLCRNTVFPATFVALGHLSEIEKSLPKVSWKILSNTEFSFKPAEIGAAALKKLSSLNNPFTLENGRKTAQFAWDGVKSIDIFSTFDAMQKTWQSHNLEILTAAAIGATSTIINGILKQTPGIKNSPYLRLAASIGLGTAAVYVGGQELGFKVDPQKIIDIAIRIAIVGGCTKLIIKTTQLGFKGIRGSSDTIATGIRKICNFGIAVTEIFNWGSLPQGPAGRKKFDRDSFEAVDSPEPPPAAAAKSDGRKKEREAPGRAAPAAASLKGTGGRKTRETNSDAFVDADDAKKAEKKEKKERVASPKAAPSPSPAKPAAEKKNDQEPVSDDEFSAVAKTPPGPPSKKSAAVKKADKESGSDSDTDPKKTAEQPAAATASTLPTGASSDSGAS